MFKFLERLFSHWYGIPRRHVPKWIKRELHRNKYVVDRKREYKVDVTITYRTPSRWEFEEMGGHWGTFGMPSSEEARKWHRIKIKKVNYYYRKL